jgi:hypothetical protein
MVSNLNSGKRILVLVWQNVGFSLSVDSPGLPAKPEPPHVAAGACHALPIYHQGRPIQKSLARSNRISYAVIVNS